MSRFHGFPARRWVGLALIAAALGIGIVTVQQADTRTMMVIAARDIAMGVELQAEDLTAVPVFLSGAAGLYAEDEEALVGTVAPRNFARGELMPLSVQSQGSVPMRQVLSVPIRPQFLPPLVRGDHIDLWATPEESPPTLILANVTVLDARPSSTTQATLTLSVPPAQVPAVLAAAENARVSVARR